MAVGIWLIGARGSLGTTVAAGLAALSTNGMEPWGLTSERDEFAGCNLVPTSDLLVGGHDITSIPLRKRAEELTEAGVIHPAVLAVTADRLDETDKRIRYGIESTEASMTVIARLQADIRAFAAASNLDNVVVVNVASTEAVFQPSERRQSLARLRESLHKGEAALPPSSIYAFAALDAGFAFVDFTPSTGARLPALEELAVEKGVPHAGRDGKTGETLVKTALAPMFEARNLHVRSWAGLNVLGGGDGRALAEPERAASKLQSKARSLPETLGYDVDQAVHINHIEDMGQWKTAWNHIRFEGFLGTTMSMQFTWQGCDSALAAPLIIDLARFVDAARRSGRVGALPELGFYFKDPVASNEHRIGRQFDELVQWAQTL